MMVSEHAPSMLRAAPKKRLGRWSALLSTPPDSTLPDGGTISHCSRGPPAHPACARVARFGRAAGAGVVGARQTRHRVEQDDDVLLVLDQPLGLLDDQLGDLHVAGRRSSNVDEMTSPLTDRCMSVTSSFDPGGFAPSSGLIDGCLIASQRRCTSRARGGSRSRRAASRARLRRSPLFSARVFRISKMSSCLRMPAAPGASSSLAILVSIESAESAILTRVTPSS
jgi:hypothetical protein